MGEVVVSQSVTVVEVDECVACVTHWCTATGNCCRTHNSSICSKFSLLIHDLYKYPPTHTNSMMHTGRPTGYRTPHTHTQIA